MRVFIEVTENHKSERHHWRAECGESRTLRSAGARRKRSCETTSSTGYPTAQATEKARANGSVAKRAKAAPGYEQPWWKRRMRRRTVKTPTLLRNTTASCSGGEQRRRRLRLDTPYWSLSITCWQMRKTIKNWEETTSTSVTGKQSRSGLSTA